MSFPQAAAELMRARRIADEVLRPNAERWDRDSVWPEPALRALQQAELGGLVVPGTLGGSGQGLLALTHVCEALGSADASTGLCFGMHTVAAACLVAKSTPDHDERFLKPIVQGKHWTTLALSESGTGSHFYLPQTRMRLVDGGKAYAVSGTKCFVTNGGHADSYVVSAVNGDDSAPPGHFSLLLIPADAPGLHWGAEWSGWGMRGNSSRSVELRDVRVPVENRLGKEGDQIWYVFSVVAPYFLVAMAGTYLGLAAHAFDLARTHLKKRNYAHTGGNLAEVGILQHRLGAVWANLERTRRLCYWAASAADQGSAEALPALCAAKAEVGQAAVDIVNECMTLTGGVGYRDGSTMQRLMRDARAAHVMSPTTDLLYTWLGRALLDLPLLAE